MKQQEKIHDMENEFRRNLSNDFSTKSLITNSKIVLYRDDSVK